MIAVTYREAGDRFEVITERSISRLPAFELVGLSPDASRFLVAVAEGPSPSAGVHIVLDWPAQLQSRHH